MSRFNTSLSIFLAALYVALGLFLAVASPIPMAGVVSVVPAEEYKALGSKNQ